MLNLQQYRIICNTNSSYCDYERYANVQMVNLYNQYVSLLTAEEKTVNYIK